MTTTNTQTAQRIERTASFVVKSAIEKVFPLFGPVREKEWAASWEPQVIYSMHPEVERHMIFKTQGNLPDEYYLWVVTQYRPDDFMMEYTVSAHERIWFITVICQSQNINTMVTVTYAYTGFTEEAQQLNRLALANRFVHDLKDWEQAINFYIATGRRLES